MTEEGKDETYPEYFWSPLEVSAGDLVLIHGGVLHRSFANNSDMNRHIVTWHCIEGEGCSWSEGNWQQLEGDGKEFKAYY